MDDRGSIGVLSTLAFLALFAFAMYCAAGFAGNIPPPGPGPLDRAVAESSWLGLGGKYVVDTLVAQPIQVIVAMIVVGLGLRLLASVALGDGD